MEAVVTTVADRLIHEYAPHVSEAHLRELMEIRTRWIEAAGQLDCEDRAGRANGQFWRTSLPGLAEAIG